jgi:hypothetical protein
MKIHHKLALTLATLLVGTNAALAASPVGLWEVRFSFDPGLIPGATQKICFQPDGTWFSTTVSGWQGTWFQKGDRLRWNGTADNFLTSAFGAFDSSFSIGGGEYSAMFKGTAATSSVGDWHALLDSSTCGASLATKHPARAGNPTK